MTHTARDGQPKIVRQCSLPSTAPKAVDLIVTGIAVVEVTSEGLVLEEVAPGWTPQDVQELKDAQLIIGPDLKEIDFGELRRRSGRIRKRRYPLRQDGKEEARHGNEGLLGQALR